MRDWFARDRSAFRHRTPMIGLFGVRKAGWTTVRRMREEREKERERGRQRLDEKRRERKLRQGGGGGAVLEERREREKERQRREKREKEDRTEKREQARRESVLNECVLCISMDSPRHASESKVAHPSPRLEKKEGQKKKKNKGGREGERCNREERQTFGRGGDAGRKRIGDDVRDHYCSCCPS